MISLRSQKFGYGYSILVGLVLQPLSLQYHAAAKRLHGTLAYQLLLFVSVLQFLLCLLSLGIGKHLKGRLLFCNPLLFGMLPHESQTLWQLGTPISLLSPVEYSTRVITVYFVSYSAHWAKVTMELTLMCLPSLGDHLHWSLSYAFKWLCCISYLPINCCSQWYSWFNISYPVMAGINSFPLYNLAHSILYIKKSKRIQEIEIRKLEKHKNLSYRFPNSSLI